MVSSGSARIFVSVPAAGAGTSASTLSVEISTSGSSASTRSPTCLCHSRTVPSVTDSPIWGIVICTVVVRVAIPGFNCTRVRAGSGALEGAGEAGPVPGGGRPEAETISGRGHGCPLEYSSPNAHADREQLHHVLEQSVVHGLRLEPLPEGKAVCHREDHADDPVHRDVEFEAELVRPALVDPLEAMAQRREAGEQLLTKVLVAVRVADELVEQPAPLGIRMEGAHEVGRGVARLLGRRLVRVRERPLDLLDVLLEVLIEHRQEELLLVLEVRVEGALGVAGVLGHLVDRGAFHAVAAEALGRRLHQRRAGLGLFLLAAQPLHQAATTSAPRLGTSVIARRPTRSGRWSTGRNWSRVTSVASTVFISNWAKLAPRQRRTPPPKGIQV